MFTQNDDVVPKKFTKRQWPAFSPRFLQFHADGQKLATRQLRNQAFTWWGTQPFHKQTAATQLPAKLPLLLRQPAAELLLTLLAGCGASSKLDPKSWLRANVCTARCAAD